MRKGGRTKGDGSRWRLVRFGTKGTRPLWRPLWRRRLGPLGRALLAHEALAQARELRLDAHGIDLRVQEAANGGIKVHEGILARALGLLEGRSLARAHAAAHDSSRSLEADTLT